MINHGGEAFPVAATDTNYFQPGMSLRDWYAGQALCLTTGTVPDWQLVAWFGKNASGITTEQIRAAQAFAIADAMIARGAR